MKRNQTPLLDNACRIETFRQNLIDLGIGCVPLIYRNHFSSYSEETPPHVHEGCVEVIFCRRGNLVVESDGQELPFLPGRIFVANPDSLHRVRLPQPGMITDGLIFELPKGRSSILGLDPEETRWLADQLRSFPVQLFPATERVKAAFDRLFGELIGTDLPAKAAPERTAVRLELKNCVLELLLALIEAPRTPASPRGRGNARVRKIVERMRNHPEGDFPVPELVREAGIPATAFTEAFKRETGLPPHAFLVEQRIVAAAKELEKGRLAIIEIAMKYRFASSQHFSTVFRRLVGTTPGQYRQGLRNIPSWRRKDGVDKTLLRAYRSRLVLEK